MPLYPFEATRKLCARSNWTLSNLELQKHLFLAQKDYMRDNPGRLLVLTFEAWDYGPVVPQIYRAVRRFGARPVQDIFHGVPNVLNVDDNWLYGSYERYKDRTPGQLVALTHRPGGAWANNYRPNVLGNIIPDRDIRDEARRQAA